MRGCRALDARELFVVEAELEDVGGLRAARELRIEHLVHALVGAHQEIRPAAPATVDEHALVDDIDAFFDGLPCHLRCLLPAAIDVDLTDVQAVRAQALQIGRLVRVALLVQQPGLLGQLRPRQLAASDLQPQRGQVLTRQIAREVGRGEEDRAFGCLHNQNGVSSALTVLSGSVGSTRVALGL